MQKKSKSSKQPKKRSPLSRELISKVALQFIDKHGMDTLSMRRLGKELKVEAMALYYHFKNKGELLDAVLERLVDEVVLAPRDSMAPLDWLRDFARSHRQIALDHPNAFILIPTRRFNTESSFAMYEKVLQVFKDLGLNAELSAKYFRTLGYFVSGAGLADIAGHAQEPDATPVRLETFNDPEFPLVSAVAKHLRVEKLDDVFEFGLDVIFAAMERDAQHINNRSENP